MRMKERGGSRKVRKISCQIHDFPKPGLLTPSEGLGFASHSQPSLFQQAVWKESGLGAGDLTSSLALSLNQGWVSTRVGWGVGPSQPIQWIFIHTLALTALH